MRSGGFKGSSCGDFAVSGWRNRDKVHSAKISERAQYNQHGIKSPLANFGCISNFEWNEAFQNEMYPENAINYNKSN
eukprot:6428869-Amphidinium_carterae.1